MRITLLRHGETDLNAARVWQGHANGELSETGRVQAKAAGARINPDDFDVVVASDLERTVHTAELLGVPFELDPAWREIDTGNWSGRSYDEVAAAEPEAFAAMLRGEEVRLGGAETFGDLAERVTVAFDRLAERVGEDGSALVVTHGGGILSLVARHWNIARGFDAPVLPPTNTSFTTFAFEMGAWRLTRYNDAAHLGLVHGLAAELAAEGNPLLTFVRHGETDANVQQVWQGQRDWGLNANGRAQAAALAEIFSPAGPLYASPLGRAATTAATLDGAGVTHVDGLKEIDLGRWEGLSLEAVKADWADYFRRTFEVGEDLKRGETGENVAELMARLRSTIDELMLEHPTGHVTFVSHGSAIRSFVVSVLGGGNREFRTTGILPNTGLANVISVNGRYRLSDYGMAPHRQ